MRINLILQTLLVYARTESLLSDEPVVEKSKFPGELSCIMGDVARENKSSMRKRLTVAGEADPNTTSSP